MLLEFFRQNICGACEGHGADLDLSKPIVRPLPACRFCGGTGSVRVHGAEDYGVSFESEECERCDGTGHASSEVQRP